MYVTYVSVPECKTGYNKSKIIFYNISIRTERLSTINIIILKRNIFSCNKK